MRKLAIMIMLFLLTSCSYERQDYYVGEINMYISIQRLSGSEYRVYLNKPEHFNDGYNMDRNYIDANYTAASMPAMYLYFPYGRTDTVYAKSDGAGIKRVRGIDMEIKVVKIKQLPTDSPYIFDTVVSDSTIYKTPCARVMFGDAFNDIFMFSSDGSYIGSGFKL